MYCNSKESAHNSILLLCHDNPPEVFRIARFCTNFILKKSGEDRLHITFVFDCKTYEEPFPTRNIWRPNTQSRGLKKNKIHNK